MDGNAGENEMSVRIDATDRKILDQLQRDAGQSLEDIAKAVGSSKTPVWNRIRKLREAGVIGPQTVVLDAEALGFEACFFVLIRTSEHEAEWQARFLRALKVPNARAYDAFYQALIAEVRVHNVTALLSMEEIKSTTALPLE